MIKTQVENNNKKLDEIINIKKRKIKKFNEDNNKLRKNNNNLINIIEDLNGNNELYKKHILVCTEQNDILSKELENIVDIDEKFNYKLNRANYLRNIEDENNKIINSSLNMLKQHINKYGNMGYGFWNSNNFDINTNNEDININFNNDSLQNSKAILNSENFPTLNNTLNHEENQTFFDDKEQQYREEKDQMDYSKEKKKNNEEQ